ncbi:MAG: hypothetical protein ACE5GF_04695 [Thermodesulfobacteriota bacterium]
MGLRQVVLSCSAVLLIVGSYGCAKPFLQSFVNAKELYRSEHIPEEVLQGGRMAILNATVSTGQEEYRRLLGDILEETIEAQKKEILIIRSGETLSLINKAGLAGDYARMMRDYAYTGVLDRSVLQKIGEALNASFVAQPRLIKFVQGSSTRFSVFGLTLIKTHESSVKIYLEIWKASTGEVVWSGVGESIMAGENISAKPIKFEFVARAASDMLVQKIH